MSSAALREHDQIIVFHDVTWEDYEHVLAMRGDKSAPRIAYLEGELEIMSPSREHERIKSFIGRLPEIWCIDRDIEVTPFGSWTLKGTKQDCAVEADEGYVFGTEPRERPHLAIEVEWSRSGIDELRIYQKLGVEEVWIWRKGVIEVYVLAGGTFERAERSRVVPDLDLALVASMLGHDTLTQAVRAFRRALEAERRA
jgi:Uma2 family endonuclease